MTHVDFSLRPSGIDVSPMISALQYRPSDFEFSHGWLKHVPSRHCFKFDNKGQVTIQARCDCSNRPVRKDQADELFAAYTSWRRYYWDPIRIDHEFADHFKTPNAWVALFREIRTAWRRFRGREAVISLPVPSSVYLAESRIPLK